MKDIFDQVDRSPLRSRIKAQLQEYLVEDTVYNGIKYGELFQYIWTRIKTHANTHSLIKVLEDQLEDSYGMCFTGRISRLVSVLDGFYDDVRLGLSKADELGMFYAKSEGNVVKFIELAKESGYDDADLADWVGAF